MYTHTTTTTKVQLLRRTHVNNEQLFPTNLADFASRSLQVRHIAGVAKGTLLLGFAPVIIV